MGKSRLTSKTKGEVSGLAKKRESSNRFIEGLMKKRANKDRSVLDCRSCRESPKRMAGVHERKIVRTLARESESSFLFQSLDEAAPFGVSWSL